MSQSLLSKPGTLGSSYFFPALASGVRRTIAAVSIAMLIAGCTWVKPIDGADQVSLVKSRAAQNCKRLGTTTVTSRKRVGLVARKQAKVQSELIQLAKNEAVRSAADTIVEATAMTADGEQDFHLFNCQPGAKD